jgi:hypothetical protein
MRRLALAALGTAVVTVCVTQVAASAASVSDQVRWPSHSVLAEPPRLGIGNQVIDPVAGTDFALASVNAGKSWRLRRTVLSSGRVKFGAKFPVGSIGLGGGSVWVYGSEAGAHGAITFKLYQVNPSTLAVIRSRTLASARNTAGFMGLAPDGSSDVAVGFMRSIFILNAKTGAKVGSITIRRGLLVSDVAVLGRSLYVAANGPDGGSTVFEFDARTLRQVASNSRRPLSFSVGGARLTAAPGGVWVTFRTGMLGLTVLLRQRGLSSVALPGSGTPGNLFAFVMSETTEFAGASVFLAKEGGQVGCVNPGTGRIRARGSVPGVSSTGELVGSAKGGRVLYGVSSQGVIAISPPRACR